MKVLEHYFRDILKIPMEKFENKIYTILGDRLTTARDRAVQDQRAVDQSLHAFDHLSSFRMVSGLMHYELNFISAIADNYWGDKTTNTESLSAFHHTLPNRTEINPKKIDYYAWIRFLEVVLSSLVLKAALVVVGVSELHNLKSVFLRDPHLLKDVAAKVVETYVLPSPGRLEALRIKPIKGHTMSGHAVLLMHDLMTLREMHNAIKRGHPSRILHVLKFCCPCFTPPDRTIMPTKPWSFFTTRSMSGPADMFRLHSMGCLSIHALYRCPGKSIKPTLNSTIFPYRLP
jgi:hypothetical protein